MTPKEIWELLTGCGRVIVASHVAPDGDALGSAIALGLALEKAGVTVDVVLQDPVPWRYSFLPGVGMVVPPERVCAQGHLFCLVDAPEITRAGKRVEPLFARAAETVCIDHHLPAASSCFVNRYIDTAASSTGEMILNILLAGGVELSPDMATCMYAALYSDTGQFAHGSVCPSSFRAAVTLCESGADTNLIAYMIFRRRTLEKTRLIARCLSTMRLFADGKLTLMRLDQADFDLSGANDEDAEGLIDYGIELDTAVLAIMMRPAQDGYKVSFRSREPVDAARLAARFGGGGHRLASGCTIKNRDGGAVADSLIAAALEALK